MRRNPLTLVALLTTVAVTLVILGAAPRQGVPLPLTYSGTVTIQGRPAEAGLSLVGCVQECQRYESQPATTRGGGSYRGLVVGPPDDSFLDKQITFWIVTESGRIRAAETATYKVPSDPAGLTPRLNLTFTEAVPAPAQATPTPTPLPTPVLPIPGDPSVSRIPALALLAGVAALVAAGTILFVIGRRRRAP
jgi:hypothetical protein